MIKSEVGMLIKQLNMKEKRYRDYALRELKARSKDSGGLYRYWDVFELKLINKEAGQRIAGLVLLAANAEWDTEKKLDLILEDIFNLLKDENVSVVLECIEAMRVISQCRPDLKEQFLKSTEQIDYTLYGDSEAEKIKAGVQAFEAQIQA